MADKFIFLITTPGHDWLSDPPLKSAIFELVNEINLIGVANSYLTVIGLLFKLPCSSPHLQ